MGKYRLEEVTSPKQVRAFLDMPTAIYQDDPVWVRPWDNDIESVFSPEKNPLFERGEAIRWMLYDEKNRPAGRIAAFYNLDKSATELQPTGGCGFFECIDDQEAANTLFDAAKEWLAGKGMQAMDGPINFGDRDMFWGLLVENFIHPMYGMNYNKPYYQALFENYGFRNYFNQYSFRKEINQRGLNPVVEEKARRLRENPDFEFRHIRKSEVKGMGEKFRSIYNRAWGHFPGVVEMTAEQAAKLEKTIKPIVDPELIYFAYYKGEAIGFFIMLPDINGAIKYLNGRFDLWAKLKFLYHLKVKKSCKIINAIVFGVLPEFQGKGIESGIIDAVGETIAGSKRYTHMELVWIGDFNPLMIRMVESYVNAYRYKTHVTYRYMIDPSVEFKRAPKVSASRKAKV